MRERETRQRKWSRKFFNLKIATWNCYSFSKERYDFCKSLQCDVLALTELHNKQHLIEESTFWTASQTADTHTQGPKQGKCKDPTAGVTIHHTMLHKPDLPVTNLVVTPTGDPVWQY